MGMVPKPSANPDPTLWELGIVHVTNEHPNQQCDTSIKAA